MTDCLMPVANNMPPQSFLQTANQQRLPAEGPRKLMKNMEYNERESKAKGKLSLHRHAVHNGRGNIAPHY
jgi:acyl-homoserine lactone acylase PvdQ